MNKKEYKKDSPTITINKHYLEVDGDYYYNYDQMYIEFQDKVAELRKGGSDE